MSFGERLSLLFVKILLMATWQVFLGPVYDRMDSKEV